MKGIFLVCLFIFFPVLLFAQNIGFMGIDVGMSRDQVLEVAEKIDIMKVPKNRDVEFFPVEERKIITLSIEPEVPHMYLQFYNDRLYAITIIFDERYMDFYTLDDQIKEKYGDYKGMNPETRKWEVNGIEITLEKPAVVKYIALKEFLEVTSFKVKKENQRMERKKRLLKGL